MKYTWVHRKEHIHRGEIEQLCASHLLSPFLAQVLYSRGIPQEKIEEYLIPQLRLLRLEGLEHAFQPAVEAFVGALLSGRCVAVWGDYDVDGVTSSALVHHVITRHGFPLYCHIPKREDGYGMTQEGIHFLHSEGVQMIMTVDCGITDVEPVALARSLGIDVIITDHHIPPQVLPNAVAICNPKLCETAYQHFAGVGVTFIVMALVNTMLSKHTGRTVDMRECLDLVALGSIADLVPLHGQNRIMVKNGLLLLKEAKRTGIRALKEVIGMRADAPVTAGQVGFRLAPRINASGRMGHAKDAFHLLTTNDREEARVLAERVNSYNEERQAQEEAMTQEAHAQAEVLNERASLVVYNPDWHHGIIGIVASRLVETYYKPCVVLCNDGDIIKGSARSIAELDLYDALCDCKDLFIRFGGHTAAAGMSMLPENIENFTLRFEEAVLQRIGPQPYMPSLHIDGLLSFSFAREQTFKDDLESLQPFGVKNAEPVFISPHLIIKDIRYFGEGSPHVNITLYDDTSGITLQAKAWHLASEFTTYDIGRAIEIAYSPTIEEYKGIPHSTVKVRDWNWIG